MFLIDAIKPKLEKKLKFFFYFLCNCLGEMRGKCTTSFVSFCFRFTGGNTTIQKKQKKFFFIMVFICGTQGGGGQPV